MGILSRFNDIMKANIHSLMDRAEDPMKVIEEYMRKANQDLGAVKAETAAVALNERRSKTLLDECNADIRKLQRYAEKSVEAGNEGDALKFLEKKEKRAERLDELQLAYEQASKNAECMKQMQDKLVSDIGQLEASYNELKGKQAVAAQSKYNSSFEAMEEKVNFSVDKAAALAELQSDDQNDDLDRRFAQFEKDLDSQADSSTSVKDELAALKEKHENKQ
ncbi:MAG TPA: PspA/IM30 family protein [Candidatus Paenibacillus intestinavium]|nr:PspA/IM30 family protein [Candidatus Paenibacillus intestinavium]